MKARCLECSWEGDDEYLVYTREGYICPRCGEAMIEKIISPEDVKYGEGQGHD